MKATIEVPDELYRQVKAKSALEGKAVREVTVELFRRYVRQESAGERRQSPEFIGERAAAQAGFDAEHIPSWFGMLRKHAAHVNEHDLESIRKSVARGMAKERKL